MVRSLVRFTIILSVLSLFAAVSPRFAYASGDGTKAKQVGEPNSSNYTLGPEDLLTITVRNVNEMSGDYLIRLDGTFEFPVVGTIKAEGMSPLQLKDYLQKGLSKELRDPEVTVNIKTMRPNRIYIEGSVVHPGVFDYRPGWRLSEIVALAGGLGEKAERLNAVIFRTGSPTQKVPLRKIFIDADDTADVPVQPGDSIIIQSDATVRITVSGEVRNPGVHEVFEGQGAVEALAAAGGGTGDAALSRTKLNRHGHELDVDLYDAVINADMSKNVRLMDGDSIVVPQQFARVGVSGMVVKPGSLLIPDGRPYTLSMALAEAGGLSHGAISKGIQLIRVDTDGKVKTTKYDYKLIGSKKEPDPTLQDKDVIFVPQSGATSVGDLSGFAGLFYTLRLLGGL
jgi:polysaccharide export outer membrane protein